jgi:hypothetical protein
MAVLLAAVLVSWQEPTVVGVLEGVATYYAEGVMAHVAVHRGEIPDPALYPAFLADRGLVGAVALNRAGDLGRAVWLDGPQGIEGPFLVLDCAQRDHYEDREARGHIVEVDWATAQRWGMAGPVAVDVYFRDPRPWSERPPEFLVMCCRSLP